MGRGSGILAALGVAAALSGCVKDDLSTTADFRRWDPAQCGNTIGELQRQVANARAAMAIACLGSQVPEAFQTFCGLQEPAKATAELLAAIPKDSCERYIATLDTVDLAVRTFAKAKQAVPELEQLLEGQ